MSTTELFERHSVDVRLGGRYSLANRRDMQGNRREFACRTTRVSPFQMMISVPVVGAVGERVISYFGEFGKLDGWVSDHVEGGFLIDLAVPREKRMQLAEALVAGEAAEGDRDRRPRAGAHRSGESALDSDLRRRLDARLLRHRHVGDGAAVSADLQPAIGSPLAVGRSVGRVIRHFAEGFAVKFEQPVDRDYLEHLIIKR